MSDDRDRQIEAMQDAHERGDLRAMGDSLVDLVAGDLRRAAARGETIAGHKVERVQRMVKDRETRREVDKLNAIYRANQN